MGSLPVYVVNVVASHVSLIYVGLISAAATVLIVFINIGTSSDLKPVDPEYTPNPTPFLARSL
jgi:hypothetical protein